MKLFNIACNNLKYNIKSYFLFILALTFSVGIYYNFVSLKYNPEILKMKDESMYILEGSKFTLAVLIVFLAGFFWYSSSFLLRQRKKEIGIYILSGIRKFQIGTILVIEGLFIGFIAVALGIITGTVFEKLFVMILNKIAVLEMRVKFSFSFNAVIETFLTFLFIMLVNSLFEYFIISKSKLIDLLNDSKKQEKVPKFNAFIAIIGFIILGTGYYFSILTAADFGRYSLMTVVLTIIGTYLVCGSFIPMIMKYLMKRKKILYNGSNVVAMANIFFRIKKNYRIYATLAILIAVTTTTFATVYSLKYFIDTGLEYKIPYTFGYITNKSKDINAIKDEIGKSDQKIIKNDNVRLVSTNKIGKHPTKSCIISYSEFRRFKKDSEVAKSTIEPKQNEIYVINEISMGVEKKSKLKVFGKDYGIRGDLKIPFLGEIMGYVVVMNDEEYKRVTVNMKEEQFNGILLDKPMNLGSLPEKVAARIDDISILFSFIEMYYAKLKLFGIIFFLGAFISLSFVVATGSLIYFRTLSEAWVDKKKYQILLKIGMTEKEVHNAILKQVGIAFIIPLALGVLHCCFAIGTLSNMLRYDLVYPTLISILIYVVIYGICYGSSVNKFESIIFSK